MSTAARERTPSPRRSTRSRDEASGDEASERHLAPGGEDVARVADAEAREGGTVVGARVG